MKTLSNYDKHPFTQIHGMSDQAWEGYDSILDEIYRKIKAIGKKRIIIAVDCYHGVRETEIEKAFKKLNLKKTYHTSTSNYSNDANVTVAISHSSSDVNAMRFSCNDST